MFVNNCKTFKEYSKPPLPFEGNKKLWRKNYNKILKDFEDVEIFVDLFGGSGILSRWTKNIYKDAIVIYNDFDNYRETFKQYKICFILDPPYLYTDKSDYNCRYWRLNDSIELLDILKRYPFICFNSSKSGFKDLVDILNRIFNTKITYKFIQQNMVNIIDKRTDYCLYSNYAYGAAQDN